MLFITNIHTNAKVYILSRVSWKFFKHQNNCKIRLCCSVTPSILKSGSIFNEFQTHWNIGILFIKDDSLLNPLYFHLYWRIMSCLWCWWPARLLFSAWQTVTLNHIRENFNFSFLIVTCLLFIPSILPHYSPYMG